MRIVGTIGILSTLLGPAPAVATESAPLIAVTHEELGRALEDLAAQIQALGDSWRGHFAAEAPGERPLISLMLGHRHEIGLSASQVHELERLREEFQHEAIRREADQRAAEMELAALLRADPVDMGKVEAKLREIERLRADLRLARIRTIERGKAQLTPEQRARLKSVLETSWSSRWPRAGTPWAPAPSPEPRRGF